MGETDITGEPEGGETLRASMASSSIDTGGSVSQSYLAGTIDDLERKIVSFIAKNTVLKRDFSVQFKNEVSSDKGIEVLFGNTEVSDRIQGMIHKQLKHKIQKPVDDAVKSMKTELTLDVVSKTRDIIRSDVVTPDLLSEVVHSALEKKSREIEGDLDKQITTKLNTGLRYEVPSILEEGFFRHFRERLEKIEVQLDARLKAQSQIEKVLHKTFTDKVQDLEKNCNVKLYQIERSNSRIADEMTKLRRELDTLIARSADTKNQEMDISNLHQEVLDMKSEMETKIRLELSTNHKDIESQNETIAGLAARVRVIDDELMSRQSQADNTHRIKLKEINERYVSLESSFEDHVRNFNKILMMGSGIMKEGSGVFPSNSNSTTSGLSGLTGGSIGPGITNSASGSSNALQIIAAGGGMGAGNSSSGFDIAAAMDEKSELILPVAGGTVIKGEFGEYLSAVEDFADNLYNIENQGSTSPKSLALRRALHRLHHVILESVEERFTQFSVDLAKGKKEIRVPNVTLVTTEKLQNSLENLAGQMNKKLFNFKNQEHEKNLQQIHRLELALESIVNKNIDQRVEVVKEKQISELKKTQGKMIEEVEVQLSGDRMILKEQCDLLNRRMSEEINGRFQKVRDSLAIMEEKINGHNIGVERLVEGKLLKFMMDGRSSKNKSFHPGNFTGIATDDLKLFEGVRQTNGVNSIASLNNNNVSKLQSTLLERQMNQKSTNLTSAITNDTTSNIMSERSSARGAGSQAVVVLSNSPNITDIPNNKQNGLAQPSGLKIFRPDGRQSRVRCDMGTQGYAGNQSMDANQPTDAGGFVGFRNTLLQSQSQPGLMPGQQVLEPGALQMENLIGQYEATMSALGGGKKSMSGESMGMGLQSMPGGGESANDMQQRGSAASNGLNFSMNPNFDTKSMAANQLGPNSRDLGESSNGSRKLGGSSNQSVDAIQSNATYEGSNAGFRAQQLVAASEGMDVFRAAVSGFVPEGGFLPGSIEGVADTVGTVQTQQMSQQIAFDKQSTVRPQQSIMQSTGSDDIYHEYEHAPASPSQNMSMNRNVSNDRVAGQSQAISQILAGNSQAMQSMVNNQAMGNNRASQRQSQRQSTMQSQTQSRGGLVGGQPQVGRGARTQLQSTVQIQSRPLGSQPLGGVSHRRSVKERMSIAGGTANNQTTSLADRASQRKSRQSVNIVGQDGQVRNFSPVKVDRRSMADGGQFGGENQHAGTQFRGQVTGRLGFAGASQSMINEGGTMGNYPSASQQSNIHANHTISANVAPALNSFGPNVLDGEPYESYEPVSETGHQQMTAGIRSQQSRPRQRDGGGSPGHRPSSRTNSNQRSRQRRPSQQQTGRTSQRQSKIPTGGQKMTSSPGRQIGEITTSRPAVGSRLMGTARQSQQMNGMGGSRPVSESQQIGSSQNMENRRSVPTKEPGEEEEERPSGFDNQAAMDNPANDSAAEILPLEADGLTQSKDQHRGLNPSAPDDLGLDRGDAVNQSTAPGAPLVDIPDSVDNGNGGDAELAKGNSKSSVRVHTNHS